MQTLYVARNLHSLILDLPADAAPLILMARFTEATEDVLAYKLTPILYAALERQFDKLDAAALAGTLSEERAAVAVERINRIQTHANCYLDGNLIRKARVALASELDALATVIAKYEELMGGREAVRDLERMVARCPFREPRKLAGENKSSSGNDDSNDSGLADDVASQSPDARLAS